MIFDDFSKKNMWSFVYSVSFDFGRMIHVWYDMMLIGFMFFYVRRMTNNDGVLPLNQLKSQTMTGHIRDGNSLTITNKLKQSRLLSLSPTLPIPTLQLLTPLHMATVVSPLALLYKGKNTAQALTVHFAAYSLSLHPRNTSSRADTWNTEGGERSRKAGARWGR
jgi:hypothetical protein